MGSAPWNSLSAAAVAATVIVGIGLVVGHAAARRLPGSPTLDAAAVLSFLAPAAVLGIGLIGLWNRPALRWVYGSTGHSVLWATSLATRSSVCARSAPLLRRPRCTSRKPRTAPRWIWRRLIRILVPLHARGIGFAWLLALVFCLRDLELAVLYYPPGGEPLTVRLFTLEANGPEPVVAALAVLQVAMTAAALATGAFLLRRRAA